MSVNDLIYCEKIVETKFKVKQEKVMKMMPLNPRFNELLCILSISGVE